jgi:hypothetical protein
MLHVQPTLTINNLSLPTGSEHEFYQGLRVDSDYFHKPY